MVTKNFKQAMKLILTNNSTRNAGGLECKDTNGNTKYMIKLSGWPSSSNVITSLQINNSNNPGIRIGSGNTPATENDYNLESRITSGVSATSPTFGAYVDNDGNPQLTIIFTLTNTGSSSVTIGEVGFFQNVDTRDTPSGGGGSSTLLMLDRTLLNTPVTIPPGESAAITYILKTVIAS